MNVTEDQLIANSVLNVHQGVKTEFSWTEKIKFCV